MKPILVIDTGSSSMRGILFNEFGKILTIRQSSYFMEISCSGAATQSCSSFQNSLISICRDISLFCQKEKYRISAISFTSQRSSVLALDRLGQPLGDILMWYDKRSAAICERINAQATQFLYATCGMRAMPAFSAPKMLWLKENHPDIYNKAYKLVGIQDYLIYLCTGRFVTDLTLASRTCLLDVTKGCWSDELLALFDLEKDKLCELLSPNSIAGYLTDDFSKNCGIPTGIPIICAGGDQQCSLLGQLITKPNQIGITSGTASYVAAYSRQPFFDQKMRLNLNLSQLPSKWVLEASTMSSGSVYQWIKQTFFSDEVSYQDINAEIAKTERGAGNLIMLPNLAGRGCPDWDSHAKGSFHNISFDTGKKEFARAALEGIAAEITECILVIKECLGNITCAKSTGGLSNFPIFNQMLADMTGIPVENSPIRESTAIGAWAIAVYALCLYPDIASALKSVTAISGSQTIYLPDNNAHVYYGQQMQKRAYIRGQLDNRNNNTMIP